MFAIQFQNASEGIEKDLSLHNAVEIPSLPSGEPSVLVQVLSTSLNPQDYKVAEMPFLGRRSIPPPATPGTDYVGYVRGTTLPGYEKDDLVFGSLKLPDARGTLAEFVIVRQRDAIAKIPRGAEQSKGRLREYACLGTAGLTAMQSLKELNEGSHVFINGGSGGTGTFCLQIAKNIAGASQVVTTCSTANAELVKELGADETIDYRSEDVILALEERVKQNGQQFDMIVDNVGNNPDLYWQSHRFLRKDGQFVLIGAPDVNVKFFINVAQMFFWNMIPGTSYRPFKMAIVDKSNNDLEMMADWLQSGKIRVFVGSCYSLKDVKKAFVELKSGRAKGKIVVDVQTGLP